MVTALYLLDTNICIYAARRKLPSLLARLERLQPGEALLSAITYGELQYGAAKSQHSEQAIAALEELTQWLPVQALPAGAGREYGRIRAHLEARGEPIGGNDLWIAAHACAAGLTLITHNLREFSRVPGLKAHSWAR